jgi:hypothetical protein
MKWIKSWYNGRILELNEVLRTALPTPATHQIGDPVTLWLEQYSDDPSKPFLSILEIPAYVVGVVMENQNRISYNLAFEIGSTGIFTVIEKLQGGITKRGEAYPGNDGNAMTVAELEGHKDKMLSEIRAGRSEDRRVADRRKHLRVVPLAAETTAEPQP